MTNVYIVIDDFVSVDNGYCVEITWSVRITLFQPSLAVYTKVVSLAHDGGRCIVYVHGGLDKKPHVDFVRAFIMHSDNPLMVKFRTGEL